MGKQRFDEVSIRWFVDDVEIGQYACNNFNHDSEIQEESVKYQGRSVPKLDSHYMGESFSFDMEFPAGFSDIEEVFKRFKKGVIERTAEGRLRAVVIYRDPDSTGSRGIRLTNCQISMSRRSGSTQPVVKTIRGRAEEGIEL